MAKRTQCVVFKDMLFEISIVLILEWENTELLAYMQ